MKHGGEMVIVFCLVQLWMPSLHGGKIVFENRPQAEGAACHLNSKTAGECKKITSCPTPLKSRRPNLKLCSWNEGTPVVCCPRKMVQKSEELRNPCTGCGIRPTGAEVGRTGNLALTQRTNRQFLVGGIFTRPNSWPWMVSIHRRAGRLTQFLCGGCIIKDRYVLTAAHCFSGNRSNTNYIVKAGGHKKSEGTDYNVKKIKVHNSYRRHERYYDIALLEINGRMKFDCKISPACLPSSKKQYTNRTATILGWGDTSFGGLPSEVLQEANVNITSNDICKRAYRKLNPSTLPKGITNDMICAGTPKGGVDACQGDSGGPLMIRDSSKWSVIGVVSFGYQCGVAEYPGVYTRISKFLRWIADNTK